VSDTLAAIVEKAAAGTPPERRRTRKPKGLDQAA
jgi:hypothetical protein